MGMYKLCFQSRLRRRTVLVALITPILAYVIIYGPGQVRTVSTIYRTSLTKSLSRSDTHTRSTSPIPKLQTTQLNTSTRKVEHEEEPMEPAYQVRLNLQQLQHSDTQDVFRLQLRNRMARDHWRAGRRFEGHSYRRYIKAFEKDREKYSQRVERELEDVKLLGVVGKPTLIAIAAYMHTGSTYLGSVFQNHRHTFYEYEPLRSLQALHRNNETTMFLNGTTRSLSGTYVMPDIGTHAVENMFLCQHENLDMTTLIKYYFSLNSSVNRDSGSYFRCQGHRQWVDIKRPSINRRQEIIKSMFFTPQSKARILRCLPLLTSKCKAAEIRISKFIRMTMEVTEGLLQRLPSLKLVHLLRDPRAMMDSQVRKGDMGTRLFSVFIKETSLMCDRMLSDINVRERLQARYPGRTVTMRYEDILGDPLKTAEDLFNFTGLSFTESDAEFVKRHSRQNSTERQATWRSHLDQRHLEVVNRYCRQVYDKLGYISYETITEIHNFSNPMYIINPRYSSTEL